MNDLLTYTKSELASSIDLIEKLVGLESPSTEKAAVDRCGRFLAEHLRGLGGQIEMAPNEQRGDHLISRFAGSGKPVLLLGHFDTVWPVGTLQQMPLRREGSRLHGPGVFDMKAGIALGVLALRALRATSTPNPPVVMLFTTDEEIGSGTSRTLVESEARRASAVLVLEPALPGGALKTSRKGCGEFVLTITGIAAHAGVDPGKGASAIHELADQIKALEQLQDLERGVSVNVGVVSGGSRPNVVAAEARALIDVRAPNAADAARLEAALRALQPRRPGVRLNIKGAFDRPPLERSPAVGRLFSLARDVASSLGRDLFEGSTGGGSDGNFTAAVGVPTLDGLGAVGDGAHAAHEHVDIDALPWRAALIAGLLARLTGN